MFHIFNLAISSVSTTTATTISTTSISNWVGFKQKDLKCDFFPHFIRALCIAIIAQSSTPVSVVRVRCNDTAQYPSTSLQLESNIETMRCSHIAAQYRQDTSHSEPRRIKNRECKFCCFRKYETVQLSTSRLKLFVPRAYPSWLRELGAPCGWEEDLLFVLWLCFIDGTIS